MICEKCGVRNNPESNFCVGCGNLLTPTNGGNVTTMGQTNGANPQMVSNGQPTVNVQQEMSQQIGREGVIQNSTIVTQPSSVMTLQNYFFVLIAILLKPFTALKEEGQKFSQFKNSFVLSLIISVFGVVVKLLETMWSYARVRTYDSTARKYVTKFVFENVKEIKFVKVIGTNFLVYLGIIFAIACVFYIASLIAKKQLNFSKILGIAAVAIVPFLISTLVLSPLLGMISVYLSTAISLVGGIYTVLLVYEGMNSELQLEGNGKYYFNLICFSILGIAAYYLYMHFFMDLGSELGDLLDLFK